MNVVETAQYNEMAKTVKNIVDTVPKQIKYIQDAMDKIAAYKADYPDDVTELDGYLSWGKTKLQELVDRY